MPVYLPIKPKERLYQEIVDQIQQQILSGALKPGDQIPAERDLAERFGVSRTAVREAIKSLKKAGLIETQPYRSIFLTDKGAEMADRARKRHALVVEFLLSLGVSSETAELDAEGLEHHLSAETLKAMRASTRRSRADVASPASRSPN